MATTSYAFRATRVMLLRAPGPYSRMLDLGGSSPSDKNHPVRRMDASKNCKVQAIAFDFDLLTRSVGPQQQQERVVTEAASETEREASTGTIQTDAPTTSSIELPNVVQEMAKLLRVQLGGESTPLKPKLEEDDLSGLLGNDKSPSSSKKPVQTASSPLLSSDIRAKYAAKLKNKGGLAGVDLAKQEIDETLQKGDAAGHLAARAIMSRQSAAAETKWMALTGTGNLLNYISNRSMKVAMLPIPGDENATVVGKRMRDFAKQLPQVSFDLLVEQGEDAREILDSFLEEFKLDPLKAMLVSDRDDYLRAAKDRGMVTCRVRPKNARRGNVSANYTSESVAEVMDVVNEINGISYQAVFASKQ